MSSPQPTTSIQPSISAYSPYDLALRSTRCNVRAWLLGLVPVARCPCAPLALVRCPKRSEESDKRHREKRSITRPSQRRQRLPKMRIDRSKRRGSQKKGVLLRNERKNEAGHLGYCASLVCSKPGPAWPGLMQTRKLCFLIPSMDVGERASPG